MLALSSIVHISNHKVGSIFWTTFQFLFFSSTLIGRLHMGPRMPLQNPTIHCGLREMRNNEQLTTDVI